ncbi:Dihydroneopterin aldolase-domain-containing protein [Chaetomium sp. MPI-CAGE-AT-0009]|nr:Dihydroneopterin aldolase-domain-containing protein [Chaetomium sp. MPI-CAGE-AT-0009]
MLAVFPVEILQQLDGWEITAYGFGEGHSVYSGRDAWGRTHKAQPCTVSAEVAFHAPFATAAARDALGDDTVHYGTLSKAVLASVAGFEKKRAREAEAAAEAGGPGERTLRDVLACVWRDLTGLELDGRVCDETAAEGAAPAFLDVSKVRLLSVSVALPKASLLGDGVRLTASAVFNAAEQGQMEGRAMALEVSRLKVPTLVGVNANERLAKQFVIVTVTVEGFASGEDAYTEIERDVVTAMEASSFETLEALGAHLAEVVLDSRWKEDGWQVCIRMEKPTAVPMADCPIVEVRTTWESLKRQRATGRS